jgi:hypothetical protein
VSSSWSANPPTDTACCGPVPATLYVCVDNCALCDNDPVEVPVIWDPVAEVWAGEVQCITGAILGVVLVCDGMGCDGFKLFWYCRDASSSSSSSSSFIPGDASSSFDPGGPDDWLTLLLLHCDGNNGSGTFTDSSFFGRTVTAYDNAQISTAQSQFGGASGLFDGLADRLHFGNAFEFGTIGTGDFTVDFWVRANGALDDKFFLEGRFAVGNLHITTGGYSSTVGVLRYVSGSGTLLSTTEIDDGNWHHCAIVRYSGTTKLYVNGVNEGGSLSDSDNYSTTSGNWYISANGYGITTGNLNAYLDEFRISRVARWTSDFTPPAAAHTPD